ncbi:MAG TPA: FHA domain-containing protein [Chloroflexi bacterium]|nr:FHA domain-containing protein [Chloroflexota bacterium]
MTLAHRVFVVDIEGEYRALCDDVGGVYLEFSRTAENHLNILDLNPLANDPFGAGMSTLMGFLTVALSRPLAPVERNVIVPRYYDEVMRQAGILRDDPATWDRPAPRLSDLRMVLERAEETAARELAQLLYIYTEGMYGDVFDRPSNVDLAQAPFIVFGLRDVAREIAGLYLWLITNLVWTAVSAAAAAQPIHLFVDEGWHLLQYAGTAAELGAMARRFRKHYAAIHLATQFGQDLARSPDAEVIRDAVGIVTLFGQHPRAAEDLGLLFHLEPHEVAELAQLAKGDGHPVPPARLLITSTGGDVLRFDLAASPLRVGRAPDNDMVVTTAMPGWDTVSRYHARLYDDDHRGRWVVKDEGSSNGTYVAGARTSHNVLQDGVRVAFGGMEALFRQTA